jgi:hypothetical protein
MTIRTIRACRPLAADDMLVSCSSLSSAASGRQPHMRMRRHLAENF